VRALLCATFAELRKQRVRDDKARRCVHGISGSLSRVHLVIDDLFGDVPRAVEFGQRFG
jgi:hypothetical protein